MFNYLSCPSISVIIPSFNQGQFIEDTLLSVIGQQYPNLEILVIDGGSTDNTVEILEKYSDKISYWHSKKDKGQADAINQGLHLSSGDVICWLNSDDMFMPGTLLDIGKRFQGHTDQSHFIYGAAVAIKESGESVFSNTQSAAPFDASKLTYFDYIVQPSTFWTRKLFQCVGDLNIRYNYALDWEWFIRASEVTEFEYVCKFYSVYRYHSLHKTSNGGLARRKEIVEIVEKYASDYWKRIYGEINKRYERIEKIENAFYNLEMRGTSFVLPVIFPSLLSLIKQRQDLINVLNMLRSRNSFSLKSKVNETQNPSY